MSEHDTIQAEDEVLALVQQGTPEALEQLRDEYGLVITIDGKLAQVKVPSETRKAVREGFTTGAERATEVRNAIATGARKAGRATLYGLVDAPVEAAKSAKESVSEGFQTLKQKARVRKAEAKRNHQRRVREHKQRKELRQARREARKAEKAAEAAAQEEENENS